MLSIEEKHPPPLAAQVALSLGYYKQWGMPLWYRDGALLRTGLAWGALPSDMTTLILSEVARRNLQYTFLDALSQECRIARNIADDMNPLDAFLLLRADASQIARAWLAIQ